MANRPYDAEFEPRPGEQADVDARRYESFLAALVKGGLGPRDRAERIATSVLCTLERRISAGEASDLNSALPWALRGLLRGCELHPRQRPERFGADEFLARLAEHPDVDPAEPERTARTVLSAARGLLSENEAGDVLSQLPPDLQALWAPQA